MSIGDGFVRYGAGFPDGVYHYAAPFPVYPPGQEPVPVVTETTSELRFVAHPHQDEAQLVAEVIRRLLNGELSDRARKLLEDALKRCER
jgi:hypothetical protein